MGMYNFFKGLFGKGTTGYEVEDRVETNQMPRVPRPQVASRELSNLTRSNILGQSRYYYRNDGTLKELVNNLALYSVGTGLNVQPMTKNHEFNKQATKLFTQWWKKPEITGRFTGRQVLDFISRTYDVDGEIFIIKTLDPDSGEPKLQLIEAQQVKSPENVDGFESGIKFDIYGRPEAYAVELLNGEHKIIPASSVIHLFNAERASSIRGISTFSQLLPLTNQRTELLDLTIQKARQEAKFVNALEQRSDDNAISAEDFLNNTSDIDEMRKEEEQMLFDSAHRVSNTIGGTTVSLPSGMTIKQLSNNTPGNTYLGFAEQLLKLSSCGLMPYGFADPSNLTGVSVRMVIAKAGRVISQRQDIICEVMTSIYQYFIGCAVANGHLTVPEDIQGNMFAVAWQCPKSVTVDYGKDEKTDIMLLEKGAKPIEDYFAERGLDFTSEVEKRIESINTVKSLCEQNGIDPSAVIPALFNSK